MPNLVDPVQYTALLTAAILISVCLFATSKEEPQETTETSKLLSDTSRPCDKGAA